MNSHAKKLSETLKRTGCMLTRLRCLNGTELKLIAVAAMLTDHFSKIILFLIVRDCLAPMAQSGAISELSLKTSNTLLTVLPQSIGRMAFPIFCFLAAEGFVHTRSRIRYMGLMLIFAVISEIPFDLAFFSAVSEQQGTFPFWFDAQNVFFTLFFGLAALCFIDKFEFTDIKSILLSIAGTAAVLFAAWLAKCDYSCKGVLFILGFYIFRKNRLLQITVFLAVYLLTSGGNPNICILLACFAILLYNGQRGRVRSKYFFYLFYPIHLAVLYVLSVIWEWIIL